MYEKYRDVSSFIQTPPRKQYEQEVFSAFLLRNEKQQKQRNQWTE